MAPVLSWHEQIKRKIHGFRIPLSKRGQRIAAVVYFTVPIIGGCLLMERVMQYSEDHKADWLTPEHEEKVRAIQAEALANAAKQRAHHNSNSNSSSPHQ